MNVTYDPSVAAAQVRDQVQVSVLKEQQDLQKQNAQQLINAATPPRENTGPRQPSANPPGVGQNINIVV